jgi:hypothetical protein
MLDLRYRTLDENLADELRILVCAWRRAGGAGAVVMIAAAHV